MEKLSLANSGFRRDNQSSGSRRAAPPAPMSFHGLTLPTPVSATAPAAATSRGGGLADSDSESSPVTSEYESVSDVAVGGASNATNTAVTTAHLKRPLSSSSAARDDSNDAIQLQLLQRLKQAYPEDDGQDRKMAIPGGDDADAVADADATHDSAHAPPPSRHDVAGSAAVRGHGLYNLHGEGNGSAPPDGISSVPVQPTTDIDRFDYNAEKILLTTSDDDAAWVAQAEAIAARSNCLTELTQRFNFSTFPRDGTVAALVCSARFTTAWKILEETISGPVWAAMRCHGLQSHYKSHQLPCDVFTMARWAAANIRVMGTPAQPEPERMSMLREAQEGTEASYPNARIHQAGIQWLRERLHDLAVAGDWKIAAAIYDPLPDWAPRPPPAQKEQYVSAYPPVPEAAAAATPPASSSSSSAAAAATAAAAIAHTDSGSFAAQPSNNKVAIPPSPATAGDAEPPAKRKRGRPPRPKP